MSFQLHYRAESRRLTASAGPGTSTDTNPQPISQHPMAKLPRSLERRRCGTIRRAVTFELGLMVERSQEVTFVETGHLSQATPVKVFHNAVYERLALGVSSHRIRYRVSFPVG
jgi:hypothetical protein